MRLLRPVFTIGGVTLLSRFAGLARDIMLAAYLGAGAVADAFVTALQFPNVFRRIFAEGAFNAAFVPLYAGRLQAEGEAAAADFASETFSALLFAMLVLVAGLQLLMPWLMYALGPGFIGDPDLFALAVLLTQITLPYLLFMSLTAMLSGVLNSHERFALPAAAPVLFNLVLIAVLALSDARDHDLALYLSIGISVSGVLQVALLWAAMRRAGVALRWRRPRLTPGVKRLVALGLPGALAAGVLQINILISGSIATLQEGARSWMYYAERLYQLPLSVVGIAMGVALLPALTKRLRAGDEQGARDGMNRAMEISLALSLPAAAAMAVMPEFIISGLLERDEFTAHDARQAGWALLVFALGLPAAILAKVFSPGFFAREDTITPMRFAIVSVLVNIVLGVSLFFGGAGFVGLVAATSVAAWLNAGLLGATLIRRGLWRFDARLMRRFGGIAAATLVMSVLVALLAANRAWLQGVLFGSDILALGFVCAAGLGVYGLAALATGALRPGEVREALKKP
ncbi:MAG: murein biosynthesis integral membrane protein MurJ [Maricaulaceae bacterium]|nr:murein biosynthesis integral membrane protein MurJ [Maricaulaceae bacterium]